MSAFLDPMPEDYAQLNAELNARGWELITMQVGLDHIRLDFRPQHATAETGRLTVTGQDFMAARAKVLTRIEEETSSAP